MQAFVRALQVQLPGGPVESLLLIASLVLAGWAFRRVAGSGTAALIVAGSVAAFAQVGHPSIPMAIAGAGLLLNVRPARGQANAPSAASFGRELLLVMGGLTLYEIARFSLVSTESEAIANAERVISFERGLGLFLEPDIQRWLTGSEPVSRVLGTIYSHGFLAAITGVLVWLHFADPVRYRLYRNALGLSTLGAVVLIALYPVAPPRLMPGLGIEDTVVALGREHKFANEYAAIPSLHVGWIALTGYVLALPYRGGRFWAVLLLPVALMQLTVIATGNHYWLDGVVGSCLVLGPALVLARPGRGAARVGRLPAWWRARGLDGPAILRLRISGLGLGALIVYLGVAQVLRPGFTDFWGYLFFQQVAVLALMFAGELVFARRGGLSLGTHIVAVVCCYADVLGTDGDLYARIDEYDKLTHFLGTAAITAGTFDILRGLSASGRANRTDHLTIAITVGIAAGFGWEVYEYLGDKVFHSTRVQSEWDTLNDLVSDSLGAVAIAWLLWLQERSTPAPAAEVAPPGMGPP